MSDDVNKTRESLMRRKIENLTGELESLLASTNDLPNVNHLRSRVRAALSVLAAQSTPPPPPPFPAMHVRFSRPGEETDHAARAASLLDDAGRNLSGPTERLEKYARSETHAMLAVNDTLREILDHLRGVQ